MNTTEWTNEDRELYARWERAYGQDANWFFHEGECLRVVDEEGVLPTEVGEWQANRAEEAAQG